MRSGSSSSADMTGPVLLRAIRATVASISGSPSSARLARVALGRDGGQALLHVTMFPDVEGNDGVEPGAGFGVKVAPVDEVVGQGRRFVAGPGVEGRDQSSLIDHAVLKCEQSEE